MSPAAKSSSETFDPLAAFPALEERLLHGSMPRALIFCAPSKGGFEPYFSARALDLWKARVREEKGLDLFLHDAEDGERFQLRALCDDLQTAPLFGGAKAVLVRRADGLCRNARAAKSEPHPFEVAVLRFLAEKTANPKALLFLAFESLTPKSPLLSEATRSGATLFESRKLYASSPPWADYGGPTELERWIGLRARGRKLALPTGAAAQIAQTCGADLAEVEKELDRFASGSPMRQRPARVTAEATPRALLDPWFRGDLPRALAVLDQMFREGLVTWDGDKVNQPRAIFPILAASLLTELRGKPLTPAARKAWEGLLELERSVKSGRNPDARLAMERFFVACAPRAMAGAGGRA